MNSFDREGQEVDLKLFGEYTGVHRRLAIEFLPCRPEQLTAENFDQ